MLRSVQLNYVRLLQSVYVQTLETKPELAAFTQHLTWDLSDDRSWPLAKDMPVSRLWSTFEPLTAVRTLSLRSDVLSYTSGPPTPLFPNLVQAQVEGTFPQNALGQILFTSPYLKHLTIAPDTKEYQHRPGSSHAYGTGIEPFLRDSISERAFRGLRTLDIALDSGVNPSLAVQFMSMSAERIEELRIAYNFGEPLTAYENWVIPMLATGTWRRLRKLALPRVAVPNDAEQRLRKYCPALAIMCCDR
ncbi:hypothetical protein RhiJN_18554 [Ceratobasidium sp. AG-Ba]|nr:hypothetical protein RhiJN_18554 [Ceratobasidium sp. AG-Ba]